MRVHILFKNGGWGDFRVFNEKLFGDVVGYFILSKVYNIGMKESALKKDYILNEYGSLKNNKSKGYIGGKTEEEIYSNLGFQYIPLKLRKDSYKIESVSNNRIPQLIELKDIKDDIHYPTSYTDRINSIQDIVNYLSKRYEWFFIVDHPSPLTQKILFKRDEFDIDYDRVFKEIQKLNTVFEVNGQPELDLSGVNLKRVKSCGLKIIITSETHSSNYFNFIEYYIKENRIKKGSFYENTTN